MKSIRFLSVMAMSALLPLACSLFDKEALRVSSFKPTGIIPQNSIVEVTFSRGVVLPESTNVWTDEPYITFDPPIAGKFVWQDSTRLVFSPDAPLAGDAEYTATLNSELLQKKSGAPSVAGTTSYEFSTEPFFMKKADFFYDRIDNRRAVGVKANLEFTYAVEPDALSRALTVEVEGKEHEAVKVVTTEAARLVALEIGGLSQLEVPQKIVLTFDDELMSVESKTRITLKDPWTYTLPGLEELKILGHEVGFEKGEGFIRVRTSQEVDAEEAKSFVKVEPGRQVSISVEDRMGFVIRGEFATNETYILNIREGLESLIGGKTKNEYRADIIIANMKPSFGFGSEGTYMLLGGAQSLEIKSINLDSVSVRVSQIFQNNIVFFLSEGRYYDWEYYEDDDGESSYQRKFRYNVGNYGRRLAQTYVRVEKAQNSEVTSSIDVTPYLRTDFKGFLLVEIADPAESWRTTSKLISVSDIGLIVKRSPRETAVFAVSLTTNKPVSGAEISLVSTTNQTFAKTQTDGDGRALFAEAGEEQTDFPLKLITATKGEDFNFLNLEDYRVETSRFDVGGNRESKAQYDAFLYGDRNLYRPGESVIVSGIVRNIAGPLPASMPVKITVFNPAGASVSEMMRSLNEQGSFEAAYQTPSTAKTGEYRVDLRTGDNLFLASTKVSVEDFVPDRLRISMKASKESARPGEAVSFSFEATNFFGPPAAGRSYEFEATFTEAPFVSKTFREFRFSNDAVSEDMAEPIVSDGETGDRGEGVESIRIPSHVVSRGVVRARGRVSVFDESGRPVHQAATVTVHPRDYHIGLRRDHRYYIPPNVPQKVLVVAVDREDKPIAGFKAQLEVVRREWHSVLRMHNQSGGLRYVSERRDVSVERRDVTLGTEPTEVTYSVPRSGDYAVRISKAGEAGYNEFTFYSYNWASASITSFRVDPEARVDIVLDKESYEPGERAQVLFQTPFDGTMLVTVERNKVFSYRYVDVAKNAASVEIPLDDVHMPNVYVSAVLFRKIKEQSIPLMAGHGFVPVRVERNANRLQVQITAPEKMRPKRKQAVTVTVPNEKDVFVTLAAVDEGILQIKNFQSPQPYDHFYAKKALETETFDFFRDLLPEPDRSLTSTVGGDEDAMGRRVNPLSVQRFKPVALWSGILRTDADGKATTVLDVPEFSGELRLTAVAYKNDRFGSASLPMKVSDPVVVTPALPRFAAPNDVIRMPITAFNTTETPVSLAFKVRTEGPIAAETETARLEVGANQERYVAVGLRAAGNVGKAVIHVSTVAFGDTITSTTDLPVRPVSPYTTESIVGFVEGGASISKTLPDVFLPFNRRAFVTLSTFPVVGFAKDLKYLVGYPHGCIEQTTSRAFPQVYLRDLALLLDPSIIERGSPTYFVNEAISKIVSMQLDDGRFSYWPGSGDANDWSTVYATHFLVESKRAGYSVPATTLNKALVALGVTARNKQTYDYSFYQRTQTTIRRVADKAALYALYVLALAEKPDQSLMSFYRSSPSLLTPDMWAMLAGAYGLSGDRRSFLELIEKSYKTEDPLRTSGRWYDSPVRSTALILNVLLDTDPDNTNIPRYMESLVKSYSGSYWYSTQERSFTLLAFGKAARRAGSSAMTGTIRAGGKEFAYNGGNKRFDLPVTEGKIDISVNGNGRLTYAIVTEGIRKDDDTEMKDNNIRVRRQFLDRNGYAQNVDGVKQNSLVIVRVTIRADVDRLDNVAISDLLPAGFEIENARLTETSQYSFMKDGKTPTYVDIRDDRINLYTNFHRREEQTFYYMVRAVTKGEFTYPPISAEAMYDADYSSIHGRGKLRVGE